MHEFPATTAELTTPINVGSLLVTTVVQLKSGPESAQVGPLFQNLVQAISNELQASQVPHGLYPDEHDPTVYYTVTAWPDEAAMLAFFRGPAHLTAIKLTATLAARTDSARWYAETPQLPSQSEVQAYWTAADAASSQPDTPPHLGLSA